MKFNNMKRIVSMLLCVVLTMGLFAVNVFAADEVKVTVEKVTEANVGDSITLDVTIENNPGFTNFEWLINYDKDVVELISINVSRQVEVAGSMMDIQYLNGFYEQNPDYDEEKGQGKITFGNSKAATADGVLFTLTFNVLKEGDARVAIASDLFNNSGTPVIPEGSSESAFVEGGIDLPHQHVFDKEVAEERYLVSVADCVSPAVYKKSCECGEASPTETFTYGDIDADNHKLEWVSNDEVHWKKCVRTGCEYTTDKAAHNYVEGVCECGKGDPDVEALNAAKAKILAAEIEATEDTANTADAVKELLKYVVDDAIDGTDITAEIRDKSFTGAANGDAGKAVYTVVLTKNGKTGAFDVEIEITANEVEEEKKLGMIFPKLFNVKVDCGEGGSVNTSETFKMAYGSTRTIKFTADEGYEVADVIVNGKSVGAVEKYTIKGARTTYTVKVLFEEIDG